MLYRFMYLLFLVILRTQIKIKQDTDLTDASVID